MLFSRSLIRQRKHIWKFSKSLYSQVVNVPTLYVPSRYEIYKIVKPLIEDDYIIDNIDDIKLNCEFRNIEINTNELVEKVKAWKVLKEKYSVTKSKLKEHKLEIKSQQINDRIAKLQAEVNVLKNNEREMKYKLYDLEDYLMPIFCTLPNKLHHFIPKDADVYEYHNIVKDLPFEPKSHAIIGKNMHCLEFSQISPTAYFLSGRFSDLEQAIENYFQTQLEDCDFVPISGGDFCKSFVLEACGKDPYCANHCIVLQEEGQKTRQQLNLIGSASLESMCAYFVNMNVDVRSLPLKYFTLGRLYNPPHKDCLDENLFTVVQSNSANLTTVSKKEDSDECYDLLNNTFISILSKLDLPYRVTKVCVKNLKVIESRRTQVDVWSPYLKKYITLTCVSQYNDFLSKKLQMSYGLGFEIQGYLNVAHGVTNMSTLLSLIVENTQESDGTFVVPKILQKYMLYDP